MGCSDCCYRWFSLRFSSLFPCVVAACCWEGAAIVGKTCHDMLVMTYRHDGMSFSSLYAHFPFIYYFSRHYTLLS